MLVYLHSISHFLLQRLPFHISFSPSVHSLVVALDQTLYFKRYVLNIFKVAYLRLRRISTIRHYLFVDTTKTLIGALVLSRIDYCKSLLAEIIEYLLDRLKRKRKNSE